MMKALVEAKLCKVPLHPEDSKFSRLYWSIEWSANAQSKDEASINWIYDTVIPQPKDNIL